MKTIYNLIIFNCYSRFLYTIAFIFISGLSFSQSDPGTKSITVSIAPDYDSVGKFHRFLFGEGYRKLWAAPVSIKILDFKNEKGGLTILQKGGGLQT